MSNSRLVSYIDLNTECYDKRNASIRYITVHSAGGVISLFDFSSVLRSGQRCSWNYAIDVNGNIGLYVEESNRSWSTSNPEIDHQSVNIQLSNDTNSDSGSLSASTLQALRYLCADICRRNNISSLTCKGQLDGSNLLLHSWIDTSSKCPESYLRSQCLNITTEVNLILNSSDGGKSILEEHYVTNPNVLDGTAYDSAILGQYSDPSSFASFGDVDYTKLTPYVVTVDRNVGTIDYGRLKNIRVSGVVLEAGYLYDNIHLQVSSFMNPKLQAQIQAVENADLSYGFFFYGRARNTDEAALEIKELSTIVRVHPPKLGIWIVLNLVRSQEVNNMIVDRYYDELVKLGFQNQVGFYVTPSQLKMVDWSKYQETWFLWLVDSVESTSELDTLLTPDFFRYSA